MKKILLITNIPNAYRIPLFNVLNQMLKDNSMQLHVVFAAAGYRRRLASVDLNDCKFQYTILDSAAVILGESNEQTTFNYQGLSRIIRKEKPYRVIVSGFSAATVKVFMLSILSGIKYIIWSGSVKRSGVDSLPRKILRRIFIKKSSAFIAYGSLATDYLVSMGAVKARIATAINTVDTDFFSKAMRNQNESTGVHYLTSVGYLSERKKMTQLIECIAELRKRRSDFKLDIIGDGEERHLLEKNVHDSGLEDNVVFHGFRQKEELPEFLARSSVFLFQTGFDIWGLTLNEAMASGIPCIASPNAGAVHDLIMDGENGFILPFSETKNVADRIEWLLNNKEEAAGIGKRAQEFIITHASLQKSAAGFIKAINISGE